MVRVARVIVRVERVMVRVARVTVRVARVIGYHCQETMRYSILCAEKNGLTQNGT